MPPRLLRSVSNNLPRNVVGSWWKTHERGGPRPRSGQDAAVDSWVPSRCRSTCTKANRRKRLTVQSRGLEKVLSVCSDGSRTLLRTSDSWKVSKILQGPGYNLYTLNQNVSHSKLSQEVAVHSCKMKAGVINAEAQWGCALGVLRGGEGAKASLAGRGDVF